MSHQCVGQNKNVKLAKDLPLYTASTVVISNNASFDDILQNVKRGQTITGYNQPILRHFFFLMDCVRKSWPLPPFASLLL